MTMNGLSTRALWLVAALLFLGAPHVHAELEDCGDLANTYGPYDYQTAASSATARSALQLVEAYHFTPEVERLIRGKTTPTPAPDIEFTLRVFPNHPRALLAMMNLGFKTKRDKPFLSSYTVGCWFDRAERLRQDDGTVQILYGVYLLRKGEPEAAIGKLLRAQELSGENANIHYNLGLAYFDLRDYDQALAHAHAAYGLGFPLPGLRSKLEGIGKWRPATDPEPAAARPGATTDPAAKPSAPLAPGAPASGHSGG